MTLETCVKQPQPELVQAPELMMLNFQELTSASGGSSRLKLAPDTVLKVSFMLQPQRKDQMSNTNGVGF